MPTAGVAKGAVTALAAPSGMRDSLSTYGMEVGLLEALDHRVKFLQRLCRGLYGEMMTGLC